jgi:methylmalonyl-CoA mutase
MEKLFENFSPVDMDAWVEKILADLKGKSQDILVSEPEKDIRIKAFYHNQEVPSANYPIGRDSVGWLNRKCYPQATNKLILDDLNEGIDSLGLVFTDQAAFDSLIKDVQFEHISADITFNDSLSACAFIGPKSVRLNLDVLSQGLKCGQWEHIPGDFLKFFNFHSDNPTIWIGGSIYGEAGASSVQELAFSCNHMNEYIQLLHDNGVSLADINKKITVELSVNDDFFMNVAKFKVIRKIVELIFKAYDPDYKMSPIHVIGKTSQRYLTINDSNNNLLRQTTQSMSALIGGCDEITVKARRSDDWEKDEIYQRMAKNIPLILKDEAYLDKVSDAAEGSYYVEQLCAQIELQAWNLFKEVEKMGGLIEAVEKDFIQNEIATNRTYLIEEMNKGDKTVLGINKYPSTLEDWTDIEAPVEKVGFTFKPLSLFRMEDHFKKEVHEQSKL